MTVEVGRKIVVLQSNSLLKGLIQDALDVCFQENDNTLRVRHFTFPPYFSWCSSRVVKSKAFGKLNNTPALIVSSSKNVEYCSACEHSGSTNCCIFCRNIKGSFFTPNHVRCMSSNAPLARFVYPSCESDLKSAILDLKRYSRKREILRKLAFVSSVFYHWWNIPSFLDLLKELTCRKDEHYNFLDVMIFLTEYGKARKLNDSDRSVLHNAGHNAFEKMLPLRSLTDICQLLSKFDKCLSLMLRKQSPVLYVLHPKKKEIVKQSTLLTAGQKRSRGSSELHDVFEVAESVVISKRRKLLSDTSGIPPLPIKKLTNSFCYGKYKSSRKTENIANPIFHYL